METITSEAIEKLFSKITNPNNSDLDVSALDAFCCALKTDCNLNIIAIKLIAEKTRSTNIKEALSALDLLEECMGKCGPEFRSKVGQFRFLNELIKLVSQKYFGKSTAQPVKNKILNLLLMWTVQYPQEKKIQEAYEMLRKQGVKHDPINNINLNAKPSSNKNQPPEDEMTKKLKELINSSNPLDYQAANLLIQNIVKEEQNKTLRITELRKGKENIDLLNEMINSYNSNETSNDELIIINELFEDCKNLQPTILRLTEETQLDEKTLSDALETNDQLLQVINKYNLLFKTNLPASKNIFESKINNQSLLEIPAFESNIKMEEIEFQAIKNDETHELADIFNNLVKPHSENFELLSNIDILQPQQTSNVDVLAPTKSYTDINPLLNNIDIINIKREEVRQNKLKIDLDLLVTEMLKANLKHTVNFDDIPDDIAKSSSTAKTHSDTLDDIEINLDAIEPGTEPPRTVLDKPNGLRILLNFTNKHPRPNVAVIVITVSNQSTEIIKDIRIDTTIYEPYKLRQMQPSGTSLTGIKPFHSAVEDITQIILIQSPKDCGNVHAKFSITYHVNSMSEPICETVLVKNLPIMQ